jgi:adenine-specific DNA-methyltransferase
MTMGRMIDQLESDRLALQERLDGEKTQAERNRQGQFATPTALAQDILRHARTLLPRGAAVRFLDPAIGTGSFYSALLKVFPPSRVTEAMGFEIDPHYARPAERLWKESALVMKRGDFTRQTPDARFNLLVCNPPYVRHHHMENEEKLRLQTRTLRACGATIGGLAGLYCHFIGLSHAWLAPGAVSIWLVPSEFMDVNYGQAVKRYLLERVTLLHIHRFDPADVQFADALVSSAVVCFRNSPPPAGHEVTFTFGGKLDAPKISKAIAAKALAHESKWTRFPAADVRGRSTLPTLADFFKVKRGLATGDNSYFILSAEEIEARGMPFECFTPILPSPRYVDVDEVDADKSGLPLLSRRLFLLDVTLPEDEIRRCYPTLSAYLDEGKARGLHERYLCRHRALWYAQEQRPPAPIVCTYLGRGDKKNGRPFRFILNRSKATVANVYLAMYPTAPLAQALAGDPGLVRKVWAILNRITPEQLLGEGRVYGGGLHKLEPRELANVPVPEIAALLPHVSRPAKQVDLFHESTP